MGEGIYGGEGGLSQTRDESLDGISHALCCITEATVGLIRINVLQAKSAVFSNSRRISLSTDFPRSKKRLISLRSA